VLLAGPNPFPRALVARFSELGVVGWLGFCMAVADECSLCNTLAYKFGYGTDIEKFKKEASDKFSLLKDGTLDMPRCARLFLVNVRSPSPCSFIPTPLSPSL
jgi:hypothetical protein